jgi:hypothetical protein
MIGDHIRVRKGGRWVHGIDGGDGAVLHLGEGPGPRVRRTYRPLFVEGAEAVEVVTHREPVFPPRSVVARAFEPLRDPALGGMFADSEAFAHWCKSGRMPTLAAGEAEGAAPPAAARTSPRKAPAARPKRPARKAAAARKPRPGKPARRSPAKRSARRKAPARKAAARKAPARKRAPARKKRR